MTLLLAATVFIGVVQADGSVTPVATHDGTTWRAAADVPARFQRVPLGGNAELAIAWAGKGRPIRFVPLDKVDEHQILERARADIPRAEQTAARDWNSHAPGAPPYPISDAEIARTALEVRTAVHTNVALDGWVYTFIEGLKRYPRDVSLEGREPPCPAITRVQVMVRARHDAALAGTHTSAEASAACLGISGMHPLALFRHEGQTYWIVRHENGTSERDYRIVRIGAGIFEPVTLAGRAAR